MSCRSVGSHRVGAQRDNQSQHGLLYTPSPPPPLCQSLYLPLLFQSLHAVNIILYLIAYSAHICQLHFCLLMHSPLRQFKDRAAVRSLYNQHTPHKNTIHCCKKYHQVHSGMSYCSIFLAIG